MQVKLQAPYVHVTPWELVVGTELELVPGPWLTVEPLLKLQSSPGTESW